MHPSCQVGRALAAAEQKSCQRAEPEGMSGPVGPLWVTRTERCSVLDASSR